MVGNGITIDIARKILEGLINAQINRSTPSQTAPNIFPLVTLPNGNVLYSDGNIGAPQVKEQKPLSVDQKILTNNRPMGQTISSGIQQPILLNLKTKATIPSSPKNVGQTQQPSNIKQNIFSGMTGGIESIKNSFKEEFAKQYNKRSHVINNDSNSYTLPKDSGAQYANLFNNPYILTSKI